MRRIILIITIVFNLFGILIAQSDFEEYARQQKQKFAEYKESVTQQYKQFEFEEKLAFERYKREVEEKWEEFKSPTKKEYVEYGENKESRTSVDFENGTVTVEVLLEDEDNIEKAQEKLQKATENIVNTTGENDVPILQNQLVSPKEEEITPSNVQTLSKELVQNEAVSVETDHQGNDGIKRTKYSIVIPLKQTHLEERAKQYEKLVLKYSKKFKVDPAIVFAIIETESAFNPKAKSHIPAYGLMQLVPSSGAKDAYLYIQANARDAYSYINQEDKYLNKSYLYNPENNIELGCAYIAKIKYHYFKNINDDEKAYICTIPSYNTGIGNVSKTLSGKPKLEAASKVANNLDSSTLYNKLITELKYKEARDYLNRVWERKNKYKNIDNAQDR